MHDNDTPRIAIIGKMRSGKSEIANRLSVIYGYTQLSFASKMKRIADELFLGSDKYPIEKIYGECPFSDDGKYVKDIRKPRRLYQDVGEKMRELDEMVWVRQVETLMHGYEDFKSHKGVVIDDMRLPVEYEWAKANDFIFIRVNADDEVRKKRMERKGDDMSAKEFTHDTELHVDGFAVDYEINNNGDKEALRRKVDEIMREITEGGRV